MNIEDEKKGRVRSKDDWRQVFCPTLRQGNDVPVEDLSRRGLAL
jgi:hypothetical protein